MSKISLFPEGKPNKEGKLSPAVIPFTNIDFDEYLDKIKDGEFQDEVLAYRTGKIEKLKLRGVTPSGVFSYRNSKSLTQHSGFIAIDIDTKDQVRKDFAEVRNELQKDSYTYALHDSVSGGGGTVVPISGSNPTPIQFVVSSSSYIPTGDSTKTITTFIGFNLLFTRNGIPQSNLSSQPSYYNWTRATGAFECVPAAQEDELFQLYAIS